MRAGLHRFAWRMWRDEAGWPGRVVRVLLLPAEALWRLVTGWRNRRWDRRGGSGVDGLAVVSVGNLAVGGTGKTPFSAWVARKLLASGASPALLLRGYGEDETRLHRRWNPGVPALLGADRLESAGRARDGGADVVVLDDGYQHRRLARDLDIVLLAAEDPLPAPVLPRGPYREPLAALRRADAVVVTRRRAGPEVARLLLERLVAARLLREGVVTASVRLAPGGIVPLQEHLGGGAPRGRAGREDGPDATRAAESGSRGVGSAVAGSPELIDPLVLTAVARPEELCRDVEALTGGEVELLAYADHHDFTAHDAREARARAGARPIVVTEKDAVKLARHLDVLGDTWVLRQSLVWDSGEAALARRLAEVRRAIGERRR